MFKLGKYYDVTYKQKERLFKNKIGYINLTLHNLMFYKSTDCYFVFWTGKQIIRINKKNLINFEEK